MCVLAYELTIAHMPKHYIIIDAFEVSRHRTRRQPLSDRLALDERAPEFGLLTAFIFRVSQAFGVNLKKTTPVKLEILNANAVRPNGFHQERSALNYSSKVELASPIDPGVSVYGPR